MFIERDGVRLEVPEHFFTDTYRFSVTRIRNIIELSGYTPIDFAFRYKFVQRRVVGWLDPKHRKYPKPDERLRLIFIEYALVHTR